MTVRLIPRSISTLFPSFLMRGIPGGPSSVILHLIILLNPWSVVQTRSGPTRDPQFPLTDPTS